MSHVGNAVPLSEINGKMREILVPGILHDVSREQLLMRILLQKQNMFYIYKKKIINLHIFSISSMLAFAN